MCSIGKSNFIELEDWERAFQAKNRWLEPFKKLNSQPQSQCFFSPDTYPTKKVGKISLHPFFKVAFFESRRFVGWPRGSPHKSWILASNKFLEEQYYHFVSFFHSYHTNVFLSQNFLGSLRRYLKEWCKDTSLTLITRIFERKKNNKFWIGPFLFLSTMNM